MAMAHVPGIAQKLEIQAYQRPADVKNLRKTHVAFTGSPHKHPYDRDRVVLIVDPSSSNTVYYEFSKKDIRYVEELPNQVSPEGDTYLMMRIWVKKHSIAVRSSAFVVEDTRVSQIVP